MEQGDEQRQPAQASASDPMLELLKTFSQGELIAIAQHSQRIAHDGFGRLTITFERHHPRLIEIQFSEELPKLAPADRQNRKQADP